MDVPGKKPSRGRPKTLDRAHVVDLAMRAYWHEGPNEVSLNAICQRAGVSKPSVYREFGAEDGLTRATLEAYAPLVLGRMMEIISGEATFLAKIDALAHLVTKDGLHENGCLFVKMRMFKSQMGPTTQAMISELEEMALTAFTTLLTQGRASGEWTSAVPIALAARYLHAQIGLALDQRARGEDPSDTLALALSVLAPVGSPA